MIRKWVAKTIADARGAQALAHAAEYDRWVRAKVQASRESPEPAIPAHQWQSTRAEKLAQQKALQAR